MTTRRLFAVAIRQWGAVPAAVVLSVLAGVRSALAQTIFTADTLIGAADQSHDGQDIVVRGCTVTIDGAHSFSSLTLEVSGTGGVVTHSAASSMTLTIAGNVLVNASCALSVDGRGNAHDAGSGAGIAGSPYFAGGGGYGGRGGNGSGDPTAAGGGVYGSVMQPTDLGSGGGTGPYYLQPGGAGGGTVHLIVGGTLTVDGSISSGGGGGGSTGYSGAGSGGSLWISAATVAGAGTIKANGGETTYGGGGGGGRVAVYYTTLTMPAASISAYGSQSGGTTGGTGTVFLKQGSSRGTVFVDNGTRARSSNTDFPGSPTLDANMVVRNNGSVGPGAGGAGMNLTILGDLTVESSGFFSADACGSSHDAGPGAGTAGAPYFAGGGGYGGRGGDGSGDPSAAGGGVYGSLSEPVDVGSGGATDPYYHQNGGAGGGAIRLTVGGTLTVNGALSAQGGGGGGTGYSGAGSGGSLWITAGTVAGTGTIQANGGETTYGGGGGGGRVAVYFSTLTMPVTSISAYGSQAGGTTGGAGTVFLKQGSSRATVYIDNGGRPLTYNPALPGATTLDADVVIRRNGTVGPASGETDMNLTVLGNLTIESDGQFSADARGSGHDAGPGAGTAGTPYYAGGGGYGGRGGDGSGDPLAVGGGAYGSVFQPTDLGSGGATDPYYHQNGGAGGGVVRLSVGGTLTVNGSLSAQGGNGGGTGYSGAGSGGSLWITAGSVAGTGTIAANGGESTYGGGGGGGRVAVYFSSLTMPVTSIAAFGSQAGGTTGGAGTVYLKQGTNRGTIYIDDGLRLFGATTGLVESTALDADVVVRRHGSMGPGDGQTGMTLNVLGDVTVAADGRISADVRGYGHDAGPGAGTAGTTYYAGGGGYGGRGGNGNEGGAIGGGTYGSDFQPTDLGSGGATDPYYHQNGGAGGGAMRIIVGGTLTVDGSVSASGGPSGGSGYSGGGSGGSLWITAGAIDGSGSITANGGNSVYGGGGGGGRIAILLCGSQVPGSMTVTAAPGTGGSGAQVGTVFFGPPDFSITTNPRNEPACPNGTASFAVVAAGSSLSYRWQIEAMPPGSGVWTDLSDGAIAGTTSVVANTGTSSLVISDADPVMYGERFRCRVTGSCGTIASHAASLIPNSGDFNGDGDVGTDSDIEAFFACLAGSCCATCGSADFNGDGDIGTDADIESFFRVLGGGPC